MRESGIQNLIRMFMTSAGITNWRNNTGTGWAGKHQKITSAGAYKLDAGDVVIKDARPLRAGLCKGSSDIIGITPTLITPDMVGKTIGVFTAVEVKNQRGKATDLQDNFISVIRRHGGFAGVARSTDDVERIVSKR